MSGMQAVLDRAVGAFQRRSGGPPRWAACAPGRVNLIGEHTDYNGGFVLPLAIDRYCVAVGAPARDGEQSRVFAADVGESWSCDLRSPLQVASASAVPRANEVRRASAQSYIAGVMELFRRQAGPLNNLDVCISSSVPLGAGLSSSASLEIAVATLLEEVTGRRLDPVAKAKLCQAAEHEFAGVPCGLMDQLASVFGLQGHALLIDCRSFHCTPVPMPPESEALVVVIDSGVRHALATSEYAARRGSCESAARVLGVLDLRDASPRRAHAQLSDDEARCVRHVLTENARVQQAAEALRQKDMARLGRLMTESHASLRDDYRVSCAELDAIVSAATAVPGVFGARMTGGGFGGCAIALAAPDAAMALSEAVAPCSRTSFPVRVSAGAHVLPL
jgi:galactokinase